MSTQLKKFAIISSTVVLYTLAASQTFAAGAASFGSGCNGSFSALCGNSASFATIFSWVVNLLFFAAIAIALIFLIWNGIRWILSGGDKGKVDEARKGVIAALIGLVVALVAYFIINLVLNLLGLGGLNSLSVPSITLLS